MKCAAVSSLTGRRNARGRNARNSRSASGFTFVETGDSGYFVNSPGTLHFFQSSRTGLPASVSAR